MQISFETPDHPDVRMLISELDEYLFSLYPAESVYALDMASLLQPNVFFAVARDIDATVAGCGALVLTKEYGEVKRLYVRPRMRGQGFARRLLETLEAKAVQHGCQEFMLETGTNQPEALSLYKRSGYHIRGKFGGYVDDPFSIFMQKNAKEVVDDRSAAPSGFAFSGGS